MNMMLASWQNPTVPLWQRTAAEKLQTSTGWKDVTLKISGTNEQIVVPFMISARAADVKRVLAEMTETQESSIELMCKLGCSWKRHRPGDEIQSSVVVKGIKTFGRKAMTWSYPYCTIGLGSMGLRWGLHCSRAGIDHIQVDRNPQVGGNAWYNIGNATSKLQTEGPQYQLAYDPVWGNLPNFVSCEKWSYWPTRGEIIKQSVDISHEYGCEKNWRFQTEIFDIGIPHGHLKPLETAPKYNFEMNWRSTEEGNDANGVFKASCILHFPGALVVPHRKVWAGEDVFGGHIGYGFSGEFDYTQVDREDVLMIGMGAFSHENVRTLVEFGANKVWNIARHFNLLMPRVICWWVNQSTTPIHAAAVLHAMEPMYNTIGFDPWSFFSVTANADRTVATIKQYTRWGISDIYFLSLYFGKAEIIKAEVKRFKPYSAVLSNGTVLEDIKHICKVIGFDADFTVDQIHHTKAMYAVWPDNDWRRLITSDNSAIDASRFTNIALSPPMAANCHHFEHMFKYPMDVIRVIELNVIPPNYAQPELGSPCYHFTPRDHVTAYSYMWIFATACQEYDVYNNVFKKLSMHHLAPPWKWIAACEDDWNQYCKLFRDQGCTKEWPTYPYTVEYALDLFDQEEQMRLKDEKDWQYRQGQGGPGGAKPSEEAQAGQEVAQEGEKKETELEKAQRMVDTEQEQTRRANQEQNMKALGANSTSDAGKQFDFVEPRDGLALEPAKAVFRARLRQQEPPKDPKAMLAEGRGVISYIKENQRRRVVEDVKPTLTNS
mmetsp:Transcript_1392/g.3386  ORF Transcript_1392/g.3386 Transcript_1392/m.3386 type:complete len:773 (-) Transcript_1392:112-2430(-)